MNPIELQEYAGKLSFGGLHPKNIQQAFEIYEMIIEDYNYRQSKLIEKEIGEYINKNYVDVKDLALGDKNVFWVSSANQFNCNFYWEE